MKDHAFEVILENHCLSDELVEAIYERCRPVLTSESDHIVKINFNRRAPSFTSAACGALADLERLEVHASRIGSDDLVSLPKIARLMGRSREGVRLLIAGRRGPGNFPAPEYESRQELLRFWRWPTVERWFAAYEKRVARLEDHSDELAAINAALALARLRSRLPAKLRPAIDGLAFLPQRRPARRAVAS